MKSKKIIFRSTLFSFIALVAAIMTGCASPARIDQMSVAGSPAQRIAATPFRNNLAIKDVTGGRETNPMWVSSVGSSDFEQALEASLKTLGLLAPRQAGIYQLAAHLEKLDQPLMGIDMTVTASVRYIVSERSTGKEILNRTFSVPYTAKFSDAFYGVERLKIANEGAIRSNITQLIDELFLMNVSSISLK